ncbi:MAG: endonuclease/exonuclease/phosphatase family protein [Pseudomonadota bacterium]
MHRDGPGLLLRDLRRGEDAQIEAIGKVIQEVAPEVLVLSGFDYDHDLIALQAFADLLADHNVPYPYLFARRPNTGRPTGADVDGDGLLGGPRDAHGYGNFGGQGGMAILSKFPISQDLAKDHSALIWSELDLPYGPPEGTPDVLRLSTTAHWDVPLVLPSGQVLHLMTWHATPPVFDGPEDRNGRRNHDETYFWLDQIATVDAPFVVLGDANADPMDGDGRPDAIRRLLNHSRIQDPAPLSTGAPVDAIADGGVNADHRSNPAYDTVDWSDDPGGPGNLRVSYVLPSIDFRIIDTGVFWPAPSDPLRALIGADGNLASRHRLVWVDLVLDRAP